MINIEVLNVLKDDHLVFLNLSTSDTAVSKIILELPNFKKAYTIFINESITDVTPEDLKESFKTFPDGVYKMTIVDEEGSEFKTKFFRTVKANLKLKGVIEGLLCDNNEQQLENSSFVIVYLQGAESVVCKNQKLAEEFYKMALSKLNCT